MVWTQERINLLIELWVSGKSASAVAKEIGNISRNAVIGKVHRLGIASRADKKAGDMKKQKSNCQQTKAIKSVKDISKYLRPSPEYIKIKTHRKTHPPRTYSRRNILPCPPDVKSYRKLSLLELKEKSCRWPSGDPKTREFSFCGAECVQNMPYCEYHAQIAYASVSRKEAKSEHIIVKEKPKKNHDNANEYQDDINIVVKPIKHDIKDVNSAGDVFNYL